ncbi:RNA-binding cell elongation regulator Jag/EloR [Chloroflexota bacterium]
MEMLEMSGKTVEAATQQALEQLGVSREEVEVTVVSEGKSGILGLGGDQAVIQVTLLEPIVDGNKSDASELTIAVMEVLEDILELMGVQGSIIPQASPDTSGEALRPNEETNDSVSVNIEGDDLGILIGRRGQTLSCLQYIVRLIIGHQKQIWAPITVDVEGYKQRRYQALQAFAQRMAEQVKTREMPFSLEPMTAYERRIIHITLADDPEVVTESTGLGEARRVVISLKDN